MLLEAQLLALAKENEITYKDAVLILLAGDCLIALQGKKWDIISL